MLSWIGNVRTLSDVLDRPIPVRGHAFEAFSFPAGGLPALLKQPDARFTLEADLSVGREWYRYRVEPRIELGSGRLSVADEYLALVGRTGNPKGTPAIERVDSKLHVRRKGKPAHPRQEPVGLNHAIFGFSNASSGRPIRVHRAFLGKGRPASRSSFRWTEAGIGLADRSTL